MKGNKSKDDKPDSVEDVQQKAFNSMIESLNRYGPTEILRILTENSRNDTICRDLLGQFPMVVSLSEFLHTLPIVKVNKRTLKRLEKKGCLL